VSDSTKAAAAPLWWLGEYGRRYPLAWRVVDDFRARRGRDLPAWPAWCFLPIAAGISIVEHTMGATDEAALTRDQQILIASEAAVLTAIASWRMTKSVFRYDSTILGALWDSKITGDLPTHFLKRLPEWCVYLDLSGSRHATDLGIEGAWVHLEADANNAAEELRLVLAQAGSLIPISINLGGTLREGIDAVMAEGALRHGRMMADADFTRVGALIAALAEPIVSLTLYLVSEEPEIDGVGRPGNPRPEKVKGGWRTFPAPAPRYWDVGVRIGAALRAAKEREKHWRYEGTGERTVRPHVRRAHWHTYLTGPRSTEQRAVLKWLHTFLVNSADPDDLPVTVRPVQ